MVIHADGGVSHIRVGPGVARGGYTVRVLSRANLAGFQKANAAAQYLRMTRRPVPALILSLCFPAVISNLVTTAYNLTDTYFIGRLGTAQSGAIGIAFSIMTVMQAFGFFFGNGSGNSMSRELGKQHNDRAARLLAVGLAGAVLAGLTIALLGLVTLPRLVFVLGSTPTIAPYAISYLKPILCAAPMVCGSFALNGLLRYEGQSVFGMIGLVTGALLNFLLAPLFIFILHMGIFGAGLATAVCQTISFVILVTLSARLGVIRLDLRRCRPDALLNREILGGGLPSLIRQSAGSFAATCVNLAANPFGDAVIASMAIVMRVMLGANSVIIGLGQGFQPVCGYNYGAGRFDRVRRGYWFCVRLATATLLALAVGTGGVRPGPGGALPLRSRRREGRLGGVAHPVCDDGPRQVQHDVEHDAADHGQDRDRLVPGTEPVGAVFGSRGADSAASVWGDGRRDGPVGLRRLDVRGHDSVAAANPHGAAVGQDHSALMGVGHALTGGIRMVECAKVVNS